MLVEGEGRKQMSDEEGPCVKFYPKGNEKLLDSFKENRGMTGSEF